ncbi:hypothetical protein Z043_117033 [Scleropages formosus]|uniref:Si:ch73-238c9.1 n=1 Tax=Scleropages formosus TaxID=113540 RepID=A0A0P7WLK6_SCLFO|nr:UPF0449 protein C19orf25 homolog [Scleropages formosus]XP_018601365.1 UPF0449 protein C19orf25 homolog [Scleropages formosus]XP_018601366.1 UPF0449 protein C19orf25 homolog [Scleropages formosus]KPP64602.1 hypothetical protein Z043_117033 [Scleropages formosus]
MASKNKKRVILPTRPDPPSVEQILEDIGRACASDPVFSVVQDSAADVKGGSTDAAVGSRYEQSRRYLELNKWLLEAQGELVKKREELRAAGEQLECTVAEVKGRAL